MQELQTLRSQQRSDWHVKARFCGVYSFQDELKRDRCFVMFACVLSLRKRCVFRKNWF